MKFNLCISTLYYFNVFFQLPQKVPKISFTRYTAINNIYNELIIDTIGFYMPIQIQNKINGNRCIYLIVQSSFMYGIIIQVRPFCDYSYFLIFRILFFNFLKCSVLNFGIRSLRNINNTLHLCSLRCTMINIITECTMITLL